MENIKQRIFRDLDVNSRDLNIGDTEEVFIDRIDYSVESAKNKCDVDGLDWRYVSGRLAVYQNYIKNGLEVNNPYEFALERFYSKVDQGVYSQEFTRYNGEEVKEVFAALNPDYDLLYDYAGASLLNKRYFSNNEAPQEAYIALALMLAINETNNRVQIAIEIYKAIAKHKLSLATPILAGLRFPNANLASCFVLMAEDNLDSITESIKEIGAISKAGGGVGINVSNIRAKGSTVNGVKNASNGILPWVKLYNDIANAVDQNGKRAGAVTVSLDIWHYDVLDFLECQTESGKLLPLT